MYIILLSVQSEDMQFSPEQDEALLSVNRWLKDPEGQQVFRLFGYAGTGKTTLAKHFVEGIDGQVNFLAYTGKAAHVLRQKGCAGATTIHSQIYHAKEKSRRKMKELEAALAELRASGQSDSPLGREVEKDLAQERDNLSRPAFDLNTSADIRQSKLIIVDECSMVDARMGEDLLWFGVPVLVLGDPAQLPPVAGGGFFTEQTPNIMLTDIHRQAKDNPIIAMATTVREGGKLNLGDYGSSRVILKQDITPEMAMEADQILVGRNKTRHASNNRARQLLGISEDHPIPSDKIVCLRNNHDKGLLNGGLWEVEDVGQVTEDRIIMSIKSEDDEAQTVEVEGFMHYFDGREEKLQWWERKEADEFDYGYALTVHKSQGSQFNKVFLFDESGAFRENAAKWLYTGITRAAESITIVRM